MDKSTTFIEMLLPLQAELAREYHLQKYQRKLEKNRAEKERVRVKREELVKLGKLG